MEIMYARTYLYHGICAYLRQLHAWVPGLSGLITNYMRSTYNDIYLAWVVSIHHFVSSLCLSLFFSLFFFLLRCTYLYSLLYYLHPVFYTVNP